MWYYDNQHGYWCLDSSRRVYVSRHVRFHENVFPFVDKKGMFLNSSTPNSALSSPPLFFPFNFSSYIPCDDHICYKNMMFPLMLLLLRQILLALLL